jgi:hypothetical protein
MLPDESTQEPALLEFAAAVRGSGPARPRFNIYRELVHARFRDVLGVSIPHTLAYLKREWLYELVAAFIAERASRSPYVRDVAREFVDWAAPRWAAEASVPPYLPELAEFELLLFEVGAGPDDVARPSAAVSAESPLVVQAAARLARFEYAVHRIADDSVGPQRSPERRDTHVLVYRDPEQRTRVLELSGFGAALLTRLQAREPLGAAAVAACGDVGRPADDEALAEVALFLDELAGRGVILN